MWGLLRFPSLFSFSGGVSADPQERSGMRAGMRLGVKDNPNHLPNCPCARPSMHPLTPLSIHSSACPFGRLPIHSPAYPSFLSFPCTHETLVRKECSRYRYEQCWMEQDGRCARRRKDFCPKSKFLGVLHNSLLEEKASERVGWV